jgi:ATP-dependent protease ClpP protease subunit
MKLVHNRFVDPSEKIGTVMNIVGSTVYIYDYIAKPYGSEDQADPNSVTSEEFLDTVRNMTGDLTVRINSKGGELSYSLAVYNTLLEHDGKVTTIVDGYAYSCAAWVLLAGEDRQITTGGIVMIHNPVINATIDSETSVEKVMPQWKASRDSIADIIVTRTGGKITDVHNMMDAQTFMNADAAIKNGFCTSKRDGKASLPTGVRNYLPSAISEAIPEELNFDYSDLLTKSTLFRSKKLTNR